MLHRVLTSLIVLSGTLLLSQSYQGGLRGVVTDSGGGVMGGAKVELIDDATMVSRGTVTNASGEYVFSSVNRATYTILVESPGLKRFERKEVSVNTHQI